MRNFKHGRVEVTDVPTLVCYVPQEITATKLLNLNDEVTVFIGSSEVTADGDDMGMPLNPGERQDYLTYPHDVTAIFAVAPEGETALILFLTGE